MRLITHLHKLNHEPKSSKKYRKKIKSRERIQIPMETRDFSLFSKFSCNFFFFAILVDFSAPSSLVQLLGVLGFLLA